MAIKTKDISAEDSMAEQLKEFVLEVGTPYADSSRQAVERMLPRLNEMSVIDLGCGDGAATLFFREIEVTGVDINREKLKLNPIRTICKDMVSFLRSKRDNSIPNIFSHHSLEHVPNPQEVLDLIAVKLKKGGIVYIEVPANDHIHSVHHATFDSPEDLLPPGLEAIEAYTLPGEHYIIARKP